MNRKYPPNNGAKIVNTAVIYLTHSKLYVQLYYYVFFINLHPSWMKKLEYLRFIPFVLAHTLKVLKVDIADLLRSTCVWLNYKFFFPFDAYASLGRSIGVLIYNNK